MPTDNGWIKLHRKVIYSAGIGDNIEHLAIWVYLLSNATHEEMQVKFGGQLITLLPGQLLTSYQKIANHFKISKLKVQRAISDMRNDTRIDTRTDRQQSLITINNWEFYQYTNDTRNDTQMIHEARKRENQKKSFPPHPLSKEKIKENKELDKNVISVCNAHTREDTHTDLVVIGKFENVKVSQSWLSAFKAKYTYANSVIEALSRYKATHNLINDNDVPFLESFAEQDRDKYQRNEYSTFDADEFFEAALRRSYESED